MKNISAKNSNVQSWHYMIIIISYCHPDIETEGLWCYAAGQTICINVFLHTASLTQWYASTCASTHKNKTKEKTHTLEREKKGSENTRWSETHTDAAYRTASGVVVSTGVLDSHWGKQWEAFYARYWNIFLFSDPPLPSRTTKKIKKHYRHNLSRSLRSSLFLSLSISSAVHAIACAHTEGEEKKTRTHTPCDRAINNMPR